jgi:L-ascorbate metabolism protein UlaG (beta-lactamase superfamily)
MRRDSHSDREPLSLGEPPTTEQTQVVRQKTSEVIAKRQPLRATFLGVSTILLADDETAIMTDGFFSRPALARVLMGRIRPDARRIDAALAKAGVTKLAAVLTAHSHHDHAMDTAIVAEKTDAVIVGSPSTREIALGHGFSSHRIRVIDGSRRFDFGRFHVRAVFSPHSVPNLIPGNITSPLRPPVRARAYKYGGNYSFLIDHDGRRVLIHASANFTSGFLNGEHVDVVFLGIGALGLRRRWFIKKYWREVVEATGATLVIPIHWDDFFEPLGQALKPPVSGVLFRRAMCAVRELAAASDVTVKLPAAFETFDLSAFP